MAQVVVEGLRELRRDLRRVEPESDREIRTSLKRAGEVVLEAARAKAPRGTQPLPPNRRLRLAKGGRVAVQQKAVSVVWNKSQFPHAGVVHWGGEISPRGTPIRFPRRAFLRDAAAKEEPRFEQALERELDGALRRLGF